MSDEVTTDESAPAAPVPQATLVARNEGGYVGLMHLGDTVRHFIANDIAHARKLFAACGLSEFGMDQESADAVADAAVQDHADAAVAEFAAAEPAPETAPDAVPVAEQPVLGPSSDVAPEQTTDEVEPPPSADGAEEVPPEGEPARASDG